MRLATTRRGSFETGAARSPSRGVPTDCTRDVAAQLRGDLWAMHAEQRGSMGPAYSEAVAVTDDAPISPSADAVLISTDSKEAGLWLWQGEALPPPSFSRPISRHRQILP